MGTVVALWVGPNKDTDSATRAFRVLDLFDHLREGFIDSGEDMDTLLLARQLGAKLATGDKGMITWGHRLGVSFLPHALLLSL